MSWLGAYELTHPESLPERQLREVLKNSCIEISSFEKLCRNELLEIYRQVALPLPQRQCSNAKDSNAEIEMIAKKSTTVASDDTHNSTHDLNKGIKGMSHSSYVQTERLKSPINDEESIQKKIQTCSSKLEVACNGSKRRYDEQTDELTKKRQKITWP